MAAAVSAGSGASVYFNPSGVRTVAYPIDSMRRAFSAHSSPERACAATTPNRNGCPVMTLPILGEGTVGASGSGNCRILRLRCRRCRRSRAVGVVMVVATPTAASPRPPEDESEEQEPDQQNPEQA